MTSGTTTATIVAVTAMRETEARLARLLRPCSISRRTGGCTESGSSAARNISSRTCCSSVMAVSFGVEQPRLAQARETAGGTALDRSLRYAEQPGGVRLALVIQ